MMAPNSDAHIPPVNASLATKSGNLPGVPALLEAITTGMKDLAEGDSPKRREVIQKAETDKRTTKKTDFFATSARWGSSNKPASENTPRHPSR